MTIYCLNCDENTQHVITDFRQWVCEECGEVYFETKLEARLDD